MLPVLGGKDLLKKTSRQVVITGILQLGNYLGTAGGRERGNHLMGAYVRHRQMQRFLTKNYGQWIGFMTI